MYGILLSVLLLSVYLCHWIWSEFLLSDIFYALCQSVPFDWWTQTFKIIINMQSLKCTTLLFSLSFFWLWFLLSCFLPCDGVLENVLGSTSDLFIIFLSISFCIILVVVAPGIIMYVTPNSLLVCAFHHFEWSVGNSLAFGSLCLLHFKYHCLRCQMVLLFLL